MSQWSKKKYILVFSAMGEPFASGMVVHPLQY